MTISLNHIYLVIEPETYQQLAYCEFILRELCHCEIKETYLDTGQKWEGLYLYGKNTYLELLPPQGIFNFQTVGNAGLWLSVDSLHTMEKVWEEFSEKFASVAYKTTQQKIIAENKKIPWYEYIGFDYEDDTPPQLATGLMCYYPEAFHDEVLPEKEKVETITRQIANRPFYDERKLMQDITEISFCLNSLDFHRLIEYFFAINYIPHQEGVCTSFHNSELNCRLFPQFHPKQKGIRSIKIALNPDKPVPKKSISFPQVQLDFSPDGSYCELIFRDSR